MIAGSVNCPNGNVTFNPGGPITLGGTGNQTINMGNGSGLSFIGGSLLFYGGSTIGTYSLLSPLKTSATLDFQSQNFKSNGFPISAVTMSINGATPKTINMGTSLVKLNSGVGGSTLIFESLHTATTYALDSTRFVIQQNSPVFATGVQIYPGVEVHIREMVMQDSSISNHMTYFDVPAGVTTWARLWMRKLVVDVPNLALGLAGFDNNTASSFPPQTQLNIDTLELRRPSSIVADRKHEINVGKVIEPGGCAGQSVIMSNGYAPLAMNAVGGTITTSSIGYYAVAFGGAGFSATAANNLGFNTGPVSWTANPTGRTFWWIGGTGNWDDPTQWSIIGSGGMQQLPTGCLPTLQDTVVIDASGILANSVITIDSNNAYCNHIRWTGSNLGSLAGGNVVSTGVCVGNLYINGSADFATAGSIAANLFFIGNGSKTLTSSTVPYASPVIRFMGAGTYALANALTCAPAGPTYVQHSAGHFNTQGYTIDAPNFCSRSLPENAINPRTLTIANSVINIRSTVTAGSRRTIDACWLSALNATNSHIKLHSTNAATYFSVIRGNLTAGYLNPVRLGQISYTASSGTPLFLAGGADSFQVVIDTMSFGANANISCNVPTMTLNVGTYKLSSGYTYAFLPSGATYKVRDSIHTVLTACQDLVRIQSQTPSTAAKILKPALPFTVNGAIVADINVLLPLVPLTVNNGVNALGNTNVFVNSGTGRTMYWVRNAGRWSDGLGHWSIGASGGDPTINNPQGCIPRAIDDVIFDLNSFTLPNRIDTLNIDGNCRNMLWTPAAGSDAPIFAGIASQNLNVYGSLEMATGMTSPYLGKIVMQGVDPTLNAQSIDLNGVRLNGSMILSGGGRYDLLDSVHIDGNFDGLQLRRGKFYSNGQRIFAGGMNLDVRGSNAADIANSQIQLVGLGSNIGLNAVTCYSANHDAAGTWNASGSTIQSDRNTISIANTVAVNYGNIVMNSTVSNADLVGTAGNRVTFKNVTWLRTPDLSSNGSLMNGLFTMDTLRYPNSSYNKLEPGASRSYTIKDTLMLRGTNCQPGYMRSNVNNVAVNVSSNRCNFDLRFVNLRDITATTCTAAQNRDLGTNEGGNSNWDIRTIAPINQLGNDTAIVCNGPLLSISALGFGSIPGMSYLWNTGATTSTISTTAAGSYSVTVTYGPSCTAADVMNVTCSSILTMPAVELHGAAQGAANQLDWQHNMSADVAQYTVERSLDGSVFAAIGTVAAVPSQHEYAFADTQPGSGAQYYRLQIQGRNGEIAYSNAVLITRADGSFVACHPNPTAGQLTLSLQGFGEHIMATVYNASGQSVAQYALENGSRNIDLGHLPSALYTLVVRDAQGLRHSVRLQVQR